MVTDTVVCDRFVVDVSRRSVLASFSMWKLCFWFSLPIFYGSLGGFLRSYLVCELTVYTSEFIRKNMIENFDLQIEDISYFGLNFY